MNKKQIAKVLRDWWNDERTCSGTPHCNINECDLCFTCFRELCLKFGFDWNAVDMLKGDLK